MGLDAVIAEIKEKARAEAGAIVQEAEAKKTEILTDAQTQAQLIKTTAEENVQKTASHIQTQEEAAGHLAVKREILNAQKALMDEVQTKTLEQICSLPESFHKQAIASLLKKAQSEIPSGTVSCAARDSDALKEVLTSGFSSYTAGKPVHIDGGIIVESADGMLKVDYSYRTFLNQVWESGLKDASDVLFN
jgi:V/A-type H+-transporting ATPase subunit E